MDFSAAFRAILLAFVLLATAHRLPAPISEAQTPTPAPEQSTKSKRTVHTKGASERSESSTKRQTTSPAKETPRSTPQQTAEERFAGPWTDGHTTLVFNASVTSVSINTTATPDHQIITCDGKTAKWRTGIFNEHYWTLTPNPDGKTAVCTFQNRPFIVHRP